jgi:hypothetical protein
MFKLRKGDIWKAVALALAMAAPVWFIVRTLRAASRPPGAAQQSPQIATSPESQDAGTSAGEQAGSRLFAERPRTPMADVARAKIAPDPFRPYVSARPGSEGEPETASEAEAPTPSPLTSDLSGLRLTGVISDTRQPQASLTDGGQHYHISVGEVLPSGWRLIRVGDRSVTLAKNDQRVEVRLGQSPSAGGQ